MSLFELTRQLIEIESITGNEERMGEFLYAHLDRLAARYEGSIESMPVEPRRFNVFARWGDRLQGTLSTHMDTVPPFVASREDDCHIWGRGACDTKGIIAAMLQAAEDLLASGQQDFGLLFVVGEERNSVGAYAAGRSPRGSLAIINGEPTGNKLAVASKGVLRYEMAATGRMAHSAYPELGESAIHKLIDALAAVRAIPLPTDPVLGPSTLNIGTLAGGVAPNVIAGDARADVMIRLVGDSASTRQALEKAVNGLADLREVIEIPALHLSALEGFETTVVAFTTDIPAFGGQWGEPFLIGPGSIHVAHTLEERIAKSELLEAVEIYKKMVLQLCKRESK